MPVHSSATTATSPPPRSPPSSSTPTGSSSRPATQRAPTGGRDESGENAEALSGLARAFFYAGARALLVSHWEVGSHAAVKLTTGAFAELKARPAHRPRRGPAPLHARADRERHGRSRSTLRSGRRSSWSAKAAPSCRPQACRRPRLPMPAPRATRLRRRSLPRLPPAPSPRRPPRRPGPRTGSPTSGAGSGYPHRAVMRAFIQVAVAATPPNEKRCTPTTLLALPERAWRASAMS